jgi:hypothetical protein
MNKHWASTRVYSGISEGLPVHDVMTAHLVFKDIPIWIWA